jgi:hypothetical protein
MGNRGAGESSTTCNIKYPAQRRDGLTVAALHTAPRSAVHELTPLRDASKRGGMDLGMGGFVAGAAVAVADLAAPGCWTYQYFSPPFNGYASNTPSPGNFGCGTSFAAPAIAGAAALLRQRWNAMGGNWANNSASALLTNMLLMGDGWASDAGAFREAEFDPRSGAGRAHIHYPGVGNLMAPYRWTSFPVTLSEGQGVTYAVGPNSGPESSLITQYKLTIAWFESDYNNAADIILRVRDSCNGNVVIAQDTSFDMRKRITLFDADIRGRWLTYSILPLSIPGGGTRTVYVADYYHSGHPADH